MSAGTLCLPFFYPQEMNIAVFCGSHLAPNPAYAEAATAMGRLIARRGHRLIYGGSDWGYMGLVARGALEEGGLVTAVIPALFSQDVIHSLEVSDTLVVKSMAERKHRLATLSDAFVALPGGAGTLDEVTEMMTNNQLHLEGGMSEGRGAFGQSDYERMQAQRLKPIGLLNVEGFYDAFEMQLRRMTDEGLLTPNHFGALCFEATPEALLQRLGG